MTTKKLADGKALGGAGRLTHARVDTIQGFCGKAIRDNKSNAKEMAKATKAILKHYSSTEEEPKHEDCPAGSVSWCSYQRDIADGTNLHKPIENPFPEAVVEVLQPLFDRLGDENLLAATSATHKTRMNVSTMSSGEWQLKRCIVPPTKLALQSILGFFNSTKALTKPIPI